MGMGTSPSTGEALCQYGCPNISEDDLLKLVLDPRVRKEQVTEKLGATQVLTEVAQIHVQRIVTDTKAAAENIQVRLNKGEDFAKVESEASSDTTSPGGDIGWITKEGSATVTDADFSAKVFDLTTKVGEVSDPFQVGDKWYLVKILEKADKRAREQSQIDTLRQKAYDDWFKAAKDSMSSRITTKLPSLPSIPTQPAVTNPTAAPVQQTPQGPVGPPAASTITSTVGITNTTPLTATVGTTPATNATATAPSTR
jgi:peptidyl-prolyl cis-trans isomerase C